MNRTQTWHRKSSPLSAQRSTGRKFCIFGSLMLWNLNVAVVGSQEVNGQKSDNYMLGKRFHYFSLGQTLDTHSPGTIKIQFRFFSHIFTQEICIIHDITRSTCWSIRWTINGPIGPIMTTGYDPMLCTNYD